MKRIFMTGIFAIGFVAGGWIRVVGSSDSPLPPEKIVLKSDTSDVFIRTEIFGFTERDTTIDGKNFKRVEIPEEKLQQMYNDTTIVGKPQMPYIKPLIAVPDSCEFNISVYPTDYSLYDNYLLYLIPRVVFEDTNGCIFFKEVYTYDTTFYETDTLYPDKFYEVKSDGHWRDQRVLEVFLYPIQFNPYRKKMYFYTNLDLRIEYEGNVFENTRGLGPFEDIGRQILLVPDTTILLCYVVKP